MGALGIIAICRRPSSGSTHPPVLLSSRIVAAPLFATGEDMSLRPDRWRGRRRPGRCSQADKPRRGHRRSGRQHNARSGGGHRRGARGNGRLAAGRARGPAPMAAG